MGQQEKLSLGQEPAELHWEAMIGEDAVAELLREPQVSLSDKTLAPALQPQTPPSE
jgi:hypothetical protein